METESILTKAVDKAMTANEMGASPEIQAVAPGEVHVIRRNGTVTAFDAN